MVDLCPTQVSINTSNSAELEAQVPCARWGGTGWCWWPISALDIQFPYGHRQDLTVLGGIVREGDSDLLEVSEDNKKIRRSPKHALPAESKTDKQSIYVKGWDLKGTTIDSVEKYFTDKGYKVRDPNRCDNRAAPSPSRACHRFLPPGCAEHRPPGSSKARPLSNSRALRKPKSVSPRSTWWPTACCLWK